MKKAKILEEKILCQQPERYIGWPTIAKTAAGELLVVFSGDREGHICPYGKSQLIRSRDNGKTWTPPETINDTPMDDRDAGICITPNGTLVVSWFTLLIDPEAPWLATYPPETLERWKKKVAKITAEERTHWTIPRLTDNADRGHWTRRSLDNGKTWQEPVQMTGNTPHGPICLANGHLLMIGNDSFHRTTRDSRIVLEESRDEGQTWHVIGALPMFPDDGAGYLGEPHIAEVAPNKIVAMFRHEQQPYVEGRESGFLWQAESADGGRTWTAAHQTEIWGKPPHLLKLRTGELLVVYGHRRAPFSERACLSYNDGKSWDYQNEIILANALDQDLGYPASVECDDGTIWTVFYQKNKPGERTCVRGVHWGLE
ncbi:exo-alpha-sialidase [bacterium]|nr:exo-alpha-sialidase [bacterium]